MDGGGRIAILSHETPHVKIVSKWSGRDVVVFCKGARAVKCCGLIKMP